MITFFTIPKPFKGIYDIIQKNALLSWQQLVPECEIIIFGDDSSVIEYSNKIDVKCISSFKSNKYGTPLLNDIWATAKTTASNRLLCYINTDIILFPDFPEKISKINLSEFLIAGRRWDIELTELLNYNSNWEKIIFKKVKNEGILHYESGVDYFLFPKYLAPDMPEFAIGRGWWDNWLLYYFKSRLIPIIDGTEILTVHQNHDYSHVKSKNKNTTRKGVEREHNGVLAKLKYWQLIYITDSKYILNNGKIINRPFSQLLKRIIYRYITQTFGIIKLKLMSLDK